jgi:alpha-mannosidase
MVGLRLRKGVNHLLLKYHSRRGWIYCVRTQTSRKDFSFAPNSAQLWRGPVADVFEAAGELAGVPILRRLMLCHGLPWFEMDIDCDFRQSSVGGFYDDTTKLSLRWPKDDCTALAHGFAGGAGTPDEPGIVFYPVNWLDLSRPAAGLAIINFGALKHCLRDGVLYTVLAWGGDTTHFNNRSRFGDWSKKMNLRLNGRQSFRFALFPHRGDWRAARVPDVAASLLRPPLALRRRSARNDKVRSQTLLALDGDPIPTSVFERDGRLVCRAHEPYGRPPQVTCRLQGVESTPQLCDVAGNPVPAFRPWDIRNLEFSAS